MKTVLKALCAAGVMLLGMALPAGAQTSSGDVKGYMYEANLMVGVMQMAYDSDEFPSRHYYRKELSDFYETYTGDPGFSAFYTADFNVYLTKWLKVGASAGYAKAWANVFDPRGYKKIGEKTLNDYSLLGQLNSHSSTGSCSGCTPESVPEPPSGPGKTAEKHIPRFSLP